MYASALFSYPHHEVWQPVQSWVALSRESTQVHTFVPKPSTESAAQLRREYPFQNPFRKTESSRCCRLGPVGRSLFRRTGLLLAATSRTDLGRRGRSPSSQVNLVYWELPVQSPYCLGQQKTYVTLGSIFDRTEPAIGYSRYWARAPPCRL